MGTITSCGLDSISSVDRTVTQNLFLPPQISEGDYKRIPELFYIDGVATMELHPNIYRTDRIIIYSQGNASDIYYARHELLAYSNLFGCPVVSYNYPGYGLCKETPSEELCHVSLNAVVNYYLKQYDASKILLIGRSLGTGVVVHYAWKAQWCNPIVLISPYKSIGRVVCDSGIIDSMFRHNMFRSFDKIDKLCCPVRIIHGCKDSLIGISHGKDLHVRLKYPLRPVWKDKCDHNNIELEKADLMDLL